MNITEDNKEAINDIPINKNRIRKVRRIENNFIKHFIICFVLVFLAAIFVYRTEIKDFIAGFGANNPKGDKKWEFTLPFGARRQNVLLMGVDVSDNANDPFDHARSDSIYLISIAPHAKNINIISIPRDSKVYIHSRSNPDKINHAFAYGGVEASIKTIEQFNPCGLLIDKEAVLLIELDGFRQCVEYEQKILKDILQKSNALNIIQAKNQDENEEIWHARRSAYSAVTQLKPNVVTEDIVVPREKIVECVKKIDEISKKYNITVCIMGHAGDGNIHPNFALDLSNKIEKENFEKLKDELFYYAISVGGTLSGEHGIGLHKKKYLKDALDLGAFKVMQNIKKMFDNKNIINPDKIF